MRIIVKVHLPRVFNLDKGEYILSLDQEKESLTEIIKLALGDGARNIFNCLEGGECIILMNGKLIDDLTTKVNLRADLYELLVIDIVPLAIGG